MSALNPQNTAVKAGLKKPSFEGNIQDVKKAEMQLYEGAVMTLYGKDSFYETNDNRLERMRENVTQVVNKGNLDFVANTIVFARTVMNIRSFPVILTVLFAEALRNEGKQYVQLRNVVADVIQRADQIADMYAFALSVFGNKNAVPMAIKRGVADAFNKFNEYQFAKYTRDGAVKLKDVLRIVHPTANTEEQGALFAKMINDKMEIPYTWETELSRNGQLPEGERKTNRQLWTELVNSGSVGYMALLRNLRNILQAEVDTSVITTVADRISDSNQVQKSKQLPFRFLNAYKSIIDETNNVKLIRAVTNALEVSVTNVPKIGDNVWIIIDCSQSMIGGYWEHTFNSAVKKSRQRTRGTIEVVPMLTASLFASMLVKGSNHANNLAITMFSDKARHVHVNANDSVISITEHLLKHVQGGGTNLYKALAMKSSLKWEPDTVIILSDMQVTDLRGASTDFAPETIKIAINLEAYDTTPVSQSQGWLQLSGWSEKIFDFIPALREGTTIPKLLSVPYLGASVRNVVQRHSTNNGQGNSPQRDKSEI